MAKDSVTALIDNKLEAQNNVPIRLKRKKTHTIEIKTEGYEPVKYEVKKQFNKVAPSGLVWFPAALGVGIYLASQEETVTETTSWGFTNTYTQSKQPQAIIGVLLASLSYLVPLVPYATDKITGSAHRFANSDIDLTLYALPKSFTPSEVINLSVSSINVKINSGSNIGGLYRKRDQLIREYTWSEVNNIAFTDLEIQANNKLNEFGLNISGLRNIDDKLIPEGRNEYLLEAEIKELNAKTNSLPSYQFETVTKFEILWRLVTPKSRDIVFSKTITAESFVQSSFISNAVYTALDHSIYELLENEKFRDLVKINSSAPSVFEDTNNLTVSINLENDITSQNKTAKTIVNESKNGVVTIITPSGHGSGFFISKDGTLVTNAHVVKGVNSIKVKFNSGLTFNAEVLKVDSERDLALLKIPGNGYQTLPITETKPELGEELLIIGTPAEEFLEQSISKGIVSGIRLIDRVEVIQTDAPISPGNSGGPAINSKGQVIGVVSSKIIGSGVEGIGFIIPSKTLLEILKISKVKSTD